MGPTPTAKVECFSIQILGLRVFVSETERCEHWENPPSSDGRAKPCSAGATTTAWPAVYLCVYSIRAEYSRSHDERTRERSTTTYYHHACFCNNNHTGLRNARGGDVGGFIHEVGPLIHEDASGGDDDDDGPGRALAQIVAAVY